MLYILVPLKSTCIQKVTEIDFEVVHFDFWVGAGGFVLNS